MFNFFDKLFNKHCRLYTENNNNVFKYKPFLFGYDPTIIEGDFSKENIDKSIQIYFNSVLAPDDPVYKTIENYCNYIISKIDFEYLKNIEPVDENIKLSDIELNFLRYVDNWNTSYTNFPKYFILRDRIDIQELLIKLYTYGYIFIEYSHINNEEYILLTKKSKKYINSFYKDRYIKKDEKRIESIKKLEQSYKKYIKANMFIEAKIDLNKLIEIANKLEYNDLLLEYIIRHITLDLFESELNIYKARSEGCSDETIEFLFKNDDFPYSIMPRHSKEIKEFIAEGKITEEDFYDLILNEARKLPVYTNEEKLYFKYKKVFNRIKS